MELLPNTAEGIAAAIYVLLWGSAVAGTLFLLMKNWKRNLFVWVLFVFSLFPATLIVHFLVSLALRTSPGGGGDLAVLLTLLTIFTMFGVCVEASGRSLLAQAPLVSPKAVIGLCVAAYTVAFAVAAVLAMSVDTSGH